MNTLQAIENSVLVISGVPVLLDSDVATFYGVETKHINQAVGNNPDKFPPGYIIELSKEEWEILRSKISTSSWGGVRHLPKAFTEKGLYMLATILKSKRATIEAAEKEQVTHFPSSVPCTARIASVVKTVRSHSLHRRVRMTTQPTSRTR